jgi:hypothetical protein
MVSNQAVACPSCGRVLNPWNDPGEIARREGAKVFLKGYLACMGVVLGIPLVLLFLGLIYVILAMTLYQFLGIHIFPY